MKYLAALLLTVGISTALAHAEDCAPPKIVFNNNSENIFTPEQEMYLGDAIVERVERNYRVLPDEELTAYVQGIADRLAKHLPNTGIRYKVVIADVPDTNAFAMAGGRVFVTRKMISFVRSEDELAAVVGHELGHAAVRHSGIALSRYFRQLLGVSSVGDRADVFEKYNRYLETARTKKVSFPSNHTDNNQLEADRIGVYALHAAGYDVSAMATFWTRLTDAKKRNSFLSALFQGSSPQDERLREMAAAMKRLGPACAEPVPAGRAQTFEQWRKQ